MILKIGNYASYLEVRNIKDYIEPIKTKDIGEGIYIDYDKDGKIVGIEILTEVKPEYYQDYKQRR